MNPQSCHCFLFRRSLLPIFLLGLCSGWDSRSSTAIRRTRSFEKVTWQRKGLIPRVIKLWERRNVIFNRSKGPRPCKTLDAPGILGVLLPCNLQQMVDLCRRYRFGIRRRVDIFFRGNYKSVAVVCSPPTDTTMRSSQQERELHVRRKYEIQNRAAGVGVVVNQSNIH